jgi:adenylate cyclase
MGAGTDLSFRNEVAVILVADIRNYTRMSEVLPAREFSLLITDWFKESSNVIEDRGGTVDKFIGNAVMAYWLVRDSDRPAPEVDEALRSARGLIERAAAFEERLSARFPGQSFRIGIGVNLGEAVVGNVGGGAHQSFTIVGDSVNVAFRLEALTKEKGRPVVVGHRVIGHASPEFRFSDLGSADVKGRSEPISIWALDL